MKKNRLILESAMFCLLTCSVSGQVDLFRSAVANLSVTNWTNNQVQLALNCESGVTYFIESSIDSQNWTTVLTNNGGINRALAVDAPTDAAFYRVRRVILPVFAGALAAVETIDFLGFNIATDSFDSASPSYSTNGNYPFGNLNMTKANGHVVTDSMGTNALSLGNAKIKGVVRTGPGGLFTTGPSVSVGERAWVEGGSTGIEPGYFSDDMNVQFPNVVVPANFLGLPLTKASGNSKYYGIPYDYIMTSSGDYVINQNVTGGIVIASNVTARLKITGTVNITTTNQIYIAGGASLRLYMAGSTFSVGGNGIVNQNGNAASFHYLGMPSDTNVVCGANSGLVGAIYAPQAAFSLGGGGNNTYDVIGSIVTKSVRLNGHYNFHFDENLQRNEIGR